jgi:hypothetical protein
VLAEATRTLSLQADHIHEARDELSVGATTFPREYGLCSHVVDLFSGAETCREPPACDSHGRPTHIIVNDLINDARFQSRPYLKENTFARSYVAVPIFSPDGVVIGAYSVMDDYPMENIGDSELSFLHDMATTVMDYLAVMRVKTHHDHAEQMMKGLGLFVEGASSLREWWLQTDRSHRRIRKAHESLEQYNESAVKRLNNEFGVQEPLGTPQSKSLSTELVKDRDTSPQTPRPNFYPDDSTLSTIVSETSESTHSLDDGFKVSNDAALSQTSEGVQRVSFSARRQSQSAHAMNSDPGLQEGLITPDVKHVFSRASNLIRESLSLDGCVFLDASVSTFGGGSDKAVMDEVAPSAFQKSPRTPLTTSSSDDEKSKKTTNGFPYLDGHSERPHQSTQPIQGRGCGVLGFSSRTRSSLHMHKASEAYSNIPESFFRRLLKRYPHGKIFNIDEDGTLSSSEDELHQLADISREEGASAGSQAKLDQNRAKKRAAKKAEFETILKILPGARSIVFFPLWNSRLERWYAGTFAWTSDPTRILVPETELVYLAAFSNSILAEVSRLDALAATQMKVNFISSISHELRSPLHGVLASVEFLQDSKLDTMQTDMVNTIDACGKTLLDIINHGKLTFSVDEALVRVIERLTTLQ